MTTMKKIIVLLFLFMLSSSSSAAVQNKKRRFPYMKLGLIWPNGYCNTGSTICKKPVPQDFKVHAFIPYTSRNKHFTERFSYDFSKHQVANWNFSDSLPSLWPNLNYLRKDLDFWEREWKNHGIYSNMSSENYFYLAIQYAIKYKNIYSSLLKSGVVFSCDQPYKRRVLYDEITKVIGSSPEITCVNYFNDTQLREINVCINKIGVAFDCPFPFTRCGFPNTKILFASEATILNKYRQKRRKIPQPFRRIAGSGNSFVLDCNCSKQPNL